MAAPTELSRSADASRHPDGVASLPQLHDQSQTPQLDHSIERAPIDHVENEESRRAGDQIDAVIAEGLKLAVLAHEDQAEGRRLAEAFDARTPDRPEQEARIVELEKKLEQSRLLLLRKEREFGRDVAMLKSALAAAHAARASAVAVAGDKTQELEAITLRLQAASAEQDRLQALVAEHEGDRERIAADHRAAVDTLQQSLAGARGDAALQVEQSRQALAESRSALAQRLAEHSGIAARVEEQAREHDLIRAEHHRALADAETSKREALAELRSQLSQTLAARRRLASRADEQALELSRLRAEHQAALMDTEARHRDALAELRSELVHAAERAKRHEHERDRISADHALAIADLQASNEAAAATLRSNLSDAVAEHDRLTALLEVHDREGARLAAQHRRAIADLQASKQETVAECERVLTEVQQALLVRDTSRHLEIERRLIDGIDEGPQMKVDGQRLVALQRGLTQAFSQMQVVFKDVPALKPPPEAEHERAEAANLLHEPFDDADDAYILQLLEGVHGNRAAETHTDHQTGGPAPAVPGMPALKADDQPADDMFDAKDAMFARSLMDTRGPLPQSAEEDS